MSTQSPCADWSASTPIAVAPFSQAASIAPRPQSPATWNTTSEPCEIWSSAISLHFAASLKSFEYAFRVLTSGFVALTPAWKPAIQLSTGGILMPPTVGHGVGLRRQRGDDAGEVPGLLGRVLHAERRCRPHRSSTPRTPRRPARRRSGRLRRTRCPGSAVATWIVDGASRKPTATTRSFPSSTAACQVRKVVVGRVRDVDALLDVEIALGLVQARDRELVEAAIVHAARVGDEPDLDRVA